MNEKAKNKRRTDMTKYNLPPAVLEAIKKYPNDVEKQILCIYAYYGLSKPKRRHIRTGAKLCINAYLKYKSYYKAAKMLNVSPSLIYYHVKKYYNKILNAPQPICDMHIGVERGHEDEIGLSAPTISPKKRGETYG